MRSAGCLLSRHGDGAKRATGLDEATAMGTGAKGDDDTDNDPRFKDMMAMGQAAKSGRAKVVEKPD